MNILVVDDHPLFRDGFGHMVRAGWRCGLNGPCNFLTLEQAKKDAPKCRGEPRSPHVPRRWPAFVVIDVGLPGDDGFVLLQNELRIFPLPRLSFSCRAAMMSGRDDAAVRMRARAIGARGFIAKTNAPEAIIDAIDIVLAGGSVFDHPAGELPSLTPRQIEVLMLLAEGHGNKEIRHRLNIAERTVRAHLTEIFQMLGAHSRMQALLRARELGLIP